MQRHERFDQLSRADAIALAGWLRDRLLEIILSEDCSDASSPDVVGEVVFGLSNDPSFREIFLSEQEQEEWERHRLEHGDGPKQIGEFVYGRTSTPRA